MKFISAFVIALAALVALVFVAVIATAQNPVLGSYPARVECSGRNVVFFGPYPAPGWRVEYVVTYNSDDPGVPTEPQRFRVTSPPNVNGEMAFAGDIGSITPQTYGATFRIELIGSDGSLSGVRTLTAPANCDGAKRVTEAVR